MLNRCAIEALLKKRGFLVILYCILLVEGIFRLHAPAGSLKSLSFQSSLQEKVFFDYFYHLSSFLGCALQRAASSLFFVCLLSSSIVIVLKVSKSLKQTHRLKYQFDK